MPEPDTLRLEVNETASCTLSVEDMTVAPLTSKFEDRVVSFDTSMEGV